GRHTVVLGWKPSAGQSSVTPSQKSSRSQTPAAGRQRAVLLASAGQSGPVPVQVSAGSQRPAEGRHSVVAGANWSAGQSSSTPSQNSSTSQTSVAARQRAVLLASGGQSAPAPGQDPAGAHAPTGAR